MRSRHNRRLVAASVALLSCPGRAAACNAAAQSRDPCGVVECRDMGPGSAAHHIVMRRVRGKRVRYWARPFHSSLRAQRSNPESLRGKTLDCFATLAMTEYEAASNFTDTPSC